MWVISVAVTRRPDSERFGLALFNRGEPHEQISELPPYPIYGAVRPSQRATVFLNLEDAVAMWMLVSEPGGEFCDPRIEEAGGGS